MLSQEGQLVDDQDAERAPSTSRSAVERRPLARPDQDGGRLEPQETDELEEQPEVGHQESDAEHEQQIVTGPRNLHRGIRHQSADDAFSRILLLPQPRIEAVAAAGLVGALRADQDALAARDEPLRVIGRRRRRPCRSPASW